LALAGLALAAAALATGAARAASFLETLLRVSGISATPSAQKGPGEDPEAAGEIWLANVRDGTQTKLSPIGGFRSPVFAPGDRAVLALRRSALVRLPVPGGEAEALYPVEGASKLIGFDRDDPDRLLLLVEDREAGPSPAFLSLRTGRLSPLPYDRAAREERAMLLHLREWERAYGATVVYVKSEVRPGLAGAVEWTDVYLKRAGSEPVNLSRCDGPSCGQPSLSHDGRLVAFVRIQP
jgi:hypothetical protein